MVRLPTSCWLSRRWWSLVRQGDGQTRLGFQLGPLGIQTPLDRAPALPVSSLEFKKPSNQVGITRSGGSQLSPVYKLHRQIQLIFFVGLETQKQKKTYKTDSLLHPPQYKSIPISHQPKQVEETWQVGSLRIRDAEVISFLLGAPWGNVWYRTGRSFCLSAGWFIQKTP